jgi:hypothetical protein
VEARISAELQDAAEAGGRLQDGRPGAGRRPGQPQDSGHPCGARAGAQKRLVRYHNSRQRPGWEQHVVLSSDPESRRIRLFCHIGCPKQGKPPALPANKECAIPPRFNNAGHLGAVSGESEE